MSRSGYSDDGDCNTGTYNLYRATVDRAVQGKRGQKMLRDTLAALDAMPDKRLIAEELDDGDDVCALGAVMRFRGIDASKLDPEDHAGIGKALDIAPCLVAEIEFLNDDFYPYSQSHPVGNWQEQRWAYMRREIERLIEKPKESPCT